MEGNDKVKPKFKMSEEISQISIVDSSIEENILDVRSQSQSLLGDVNGTESRENQISAARNAEEFSEELIPPSPSPSPSLLDALEKRAEVPKITSSYSNATSITDKLLREAQEADRKKRYESESETDDEETQDPNLDDIDIVENEDAYVNQDEDMEKEGVDDVENVDADNIENGDVDNMQHANDDNLETEDSNKESNSENLSENNSENKEDTGSPDEALMEEEESENTNVDNSEDVMEVNNDDVNADTTEDTLVLQNQLPLSKIKKIIKGDAENNLIVSKEAVYAASIAAELFIANITQQSVKITHANKKKTISIAHLKSALSGSESFDFLEGCFPDIY